MQLPLINSAIRELQQMMSQWKAILDPLIAVPMAQGRQIKSVSVVSGNNTINHLLDRTPQGYMITGMRGAFVQIYQATSPNPTLTLVLNSNGSAVLDLWVY